MWPVSVLDLHYSNTKKLNLCTEHKTTVTSKYLKILIHLFGNQNICLATKHSKNFSTPAWQCAYYFDKCNYIHAQFLQCNTWLVKA